MKRRTLLTTTAAGLLLASLPCWLGTALANVAASDGVARAWEAAQKEKRPLLLLAIPEHSEQERLWRGVALGVLLYEGDDAMLAALGDCTLVCATPQAIRAVFPAVPDSDSLIAVLAAPGVLRVSVAAHLPTPEAGLPPMMMGGWSMSEPLLAPYGVLLGDALREVLGPLPSGPQVKAQAEAVREALGATPPAQSSWSYFDPCPPCGMMQVAAPGRRFLQLLIDIPG